MEVQPQDKKTEERQPGTALKVGVLIALIALLVVGILLPIKLVPNAFSTVGNRISDFFTPTESVKLSVDKKEIDTAVPFTLSWDGTHRTDGTYVLSYECTDSLTFTTNINQPNETIGCGTQYFFSPKDNSIDLTPVSNSNKFLDVTLTLGFLKNGDSEAKAIGSLPITIVNMNASGTDTVQGTATSTTVVLVTPTPAATPTQTPAVLATPTPAPSATPSPTPVPTKTPSSTPTSPVYTSKHRASNPYGTADLSVAVISTGLINPYTHAFVPAQSVHASDRAAVKFIVTNVGDKSTGVWRFVANLPGATPIYTSAYQQSLGPDDSIEYTLSFDGIASNYSNAFAITVDSSNNVVEVTKANNTVTGTIINLDGNGSNGGTTSYGKPDLTVAIIATGIIDRNTNAFYQSNFVGPQDKAGVRFTVTNRGSVATGQWRFTATLPIQGQNANYSSDYQPSLAPGQSATLILGFDNLTNQGSNYFSVTVNPNNQIDEANFSNNSASVSIIRN